MACLDFADGMYPVSRLQFKTQDGIDIPVCQLPVNRDEGFGFPF
jgi:hypothetical protein